MASKQFKPELLLILLIILGVTVSKCKLLTRLRNGLNCPNTDAGYYRDEVNCKKFYYCPGSSPSQAPKDEDKPLYMKILAGGFECPDGTLFDETTSECNIIEQMKSISLECTE